jgi:hypothetical protein
VTDGGHSLQRKYAVRLSRCRNQLSLANISTVDIATGGALQSKIIIDAVIEIVLLAFLDIAVDFRRLATRLEELLPTVLGPVFDGLLLPLLDRNWALGSAARCASHFALIRWVIPGRRLQNAPR